MTVIKLLRVKVIVSIILIQMLVLAAVFLLLNLTLRNREYKDSMRFLQTLAKNNGHRPFPDKPFIPMKDFSHEKKPRPLDAIGDEAFDNFFSFYSEEPRKPIERNNFAVNVSYAGVINEIIRDHPLSFTEKEISELIIKIYALGKNKGIISGVRYLITPAEYGNNLICLINRRSEIETLNQVLLFSILIYIASIISSFILSFFLSKIIIKPTEIAFERQKQFIADAGHELKTPIAVINANIDVLEPLLKDNKWFKYIKVENQRMSELVKDMLYLAKNDDNSHLQDLLFTDFDYSKAIENAVLPFESIAFENNMQLNIDIEKNIQYHGNEKEIKQIAIILVDNAIKNSESKAVINVKAYSEKQNIFLKVHNTGNGIEKKDLEKIFIRFYRSDYSRARKTGGYGLGLSIARAIANGHGGTLTAASEVGKWAEFTLALPKKH